MADKQESSGRSVVSDPNVNRRNGDDSSGTALGQQASQALEGLRSVVEQASQVLRDLTQAGGQWVQNNDRTREMAQGLRVQGEQAVGTVSRQGGGKGVKKNDRTGKLAKGRRGEGERAVGPVPRQAEKNPIMSLAAVFAMGYLLPTMPRR